MAAPTNAANVKKALTNFQMTCRAEIVAFVDAPASAPVLPPGFVPPCLPTKAPRPPTGEAWLHEIKHDGFRVIARKQDARVRLYSRPGNDLTYRFALIAESLARLRSRSCIIDGEALCCGDYGIAAFDRIRYRSHDHTVFLYAF